MTSTLPPDWTLQPVTPVELKALIIIAKRPSHAYDIMNSIEESLGHLSAVTHLGVRQALRRMTTKGWVKLTDHIQGTGRNEQTYELTDYGEAQLRHELLRLGQLLELGEHHLILLNNRRTTATDDISAIIDT